MIEPEKIGCLGSLLAYLVIILTSLVGSAQWPSNLYASESRPDYAGAGMAQQRSVQVGDTQFEYLLYQPAQLDGPAPAIFALHGAGGNTDIMRALGYELLADVDGFVVVYPSAPGTNWAVADFFGTPPHAEFPDSIRDVAYFDAILDELILENTVDPQRLFVTGGSRGGMMTLRLACERAERFLAVAPTRIVMPGGWLDSCRPSEAISVMLLMGTKDPLVPFEGGDLTFRDTSSPVLSFADTENFWLRFNGCEGESASSRLYDLDPTDGISTRVERWKPCNAGVEVLSYRVFGMGHPIPGVRIPEHLTRQITEIFGKPLEEVTGPGTRDFHGPTEVWRFFRNVMNNKQEGSGG